MSEAKRAVAVRVEPGRSAARASSRVRSPTLFRPLYVWEKPFTPVHLPLSGFLVPGVPRRVRHREHSPSLGDAQTSPSRSKCDERVDRRCSTKPAYRGLPRPHRFRVERDGRWFEEDPSVRPSARPVHRVDILRPSRSCASNRRRRARGLDPAPVLHETRTAAALVIFRRSRPYGILVGAEPT